MLPFNQLSFWEKESFIKNIDALILGSGIVGLSTAIELKKHHKNAKIVILERGYLPTGASTKNAGFACFGGAAEILDDIAKTDEATVRKTIQYRWGGLKILRNRLSDKAINFDPCGSYDLYRSDEQDEFERIAEKIDFLNAFVGDTIKTKEKIFSISNADFGFAGQPKQIKNTLDGKIDTGKMMKLLVEYAIGLGVVILNGVEVTDVDFDRNIQKIHCNYGVLSAKQLFFCTNGLSKRFFPALDLEPARAQVIVTKPIKNLKWNGTFHLEQGYYYFRNIENRILLGGARNKDFEAENTEEITNTSFIINDLKNLLNSFILPNQNPEIEMQWAGIMGVGKEKFPIIKEVQENVFCGIRLGGMGIAMGSEVGRQLAVLAQKKATA